MALIWKEYRDGLPEEIQEKIEAVIYLKEEMMVTQSEMFRLQDECAMLENELQPYRRAEQQSAQPSAQLSISIQNLQKDVVPINRCPNEILLHIFEFCLEDFCHHWKIARLLLVSKRWYSVIRNAPNLWKRVEIDETCLYYQVTSLRWGSYIAACAERSNSLPLALYMDLGQFPEQDDYVEWELEQCQKQIPRDFPHREVLRQLIDDNQCGTESPTYHPRCKQAIHGLLGQCQDRWHNLDITFPEDSELAEYTWKMLCGPTTNLVELSVRNLPSFCELDSEMESEVRPWFPSLKKLTIDHQCVAYTFIQISPETLVDLDIGFDSSLMSLYNLNELVNLQTLALRGPLARNPPWYEDPEPSVHLISLPSLRCLVLSHLHHALNHIHFDIPLLDELALEHIVEFVHPPTLDAKHIRWFIVTWPPSQEDTQPEEVLTYLLDLSAYTDTISVPWFVRDLTLELLAEQTTQIKQVNIEDNHGQIYEEIHLDLQEFA